MVQPPAADPSLARPDPRPLLVTLLVAGWLLLSFFGGLRASLALGRAATTAAVGEADPVLRMARQDPLLAGESAVRELERREAMRRLELSLAIPLLTVAVAGTAGALRLLRREPRARAMLLAVGLASLAISGAHAWRATRIYTAEAAGLPAAEEALPALFAVAGINLCIQSLPLVLALSLLRHPIVRRYAGRPPDPAAGFDAAPG